MTSEARVLTIDTVLAIPRRKTLSVALWIGAFTILTAIGAQISIPTWPVPITLQTFFVLSSGAFLGARKGFASQMAYLAAGAAGLPVFANGSGSILHLAGPTGGYLLGFPAAAFIVGYLVHDFALLQRIPSLVRAILAMTAGLAVIFLLGVSQLYLTIFHSWRTAFATGFLGLQWWDGLKLLAAASIYAEASRRYTRLG
jgi:biotin transport system substrate-specific component